MYSKVKTTVNGTDFYVSSKYRIIKPVSTCVTMENLLYGGLPCSGSAYCDVYSMVFVQIGSGAYGIVVSAEDISTGKRVAIKKVGNAFQ